MFKLFKQSLLVCWEQAKAQRILRQMGPCVTVFGSGKLNKPHRYHDLAVDLGELLAHHGYAVLNGGGPGLMAAVNQGVYQQQGLALGCQIKFNHEQPCSEHVHHALRFHSLANRKQVLIQHSHAFIFLPGGFGTLDELYELAVLMLSNKVAHQPIILLDQVYWQDLMNFHRHVLWSHGTISDQAYELLQVVDHPEEALSIINTYQQS